MPPKIKVVNDEPNTILVDAEGRMLAKCPRCEREYYLIEHGECTDGYVRRLAIEAVEAAMEVAKVQVVEHIMEVTAIREKRFNELLGKGKKEKSNEHRPR